jgi:hypothetical protein
MLRPRIRRDKLRPMRALQDVCWTDGQSHGDQMKGTDETHTPVPARHVPLWQNTHLKQITMSTLTEPPY